MTSKHNSDHHEHLRPKTMLPAFSRLQSAPTLEIKIQTIQTIFEALCNTRKKDASIKIVGEDGLNPKYQVNIGNVPAIEISFQKNLKDLSHGNIVIKALNHTDINGIILALLKEITEIFKINNGALKIHIPDSCNGIEVAKLYTTAQHQAQNPAQVYEQSIFDNIKINAHLSAKIQHVTPRNELEKTALETTISLLHAKEHQAKASKPSMT